MNNLHLYPRAMWRLAAAVILAGLYFAVANVQPAPASPLAVVRYVAASGVDAAACTSSTSPCRTIQYAVNQSATGDTIRVAQGTYTYSTATDLCGFLQNKSVICFVDKALTILGGYSTSNWSSPNPTANPTVIDGQNAYRGVAVIGYNTTTTNLRMEGFIIQNCRVQGPLYVNPYTPVGRGAGIWALHAAVTLRDMIFKNNQAIGANTTSGAGGEADGAGLTIEAAPTGTGSLLERVTFDSNISQGGTGPDRGGVAFGAVFLFNSAVTINYGTFTNNQALAGGSSGMGYAAGLYADALGGGIGIEMGSVTLTHITATGNRTVGGNAASAGAAAAPTGGGAYGAGIYAEDTTVTLVDSAILNNTATSGNAAHGGFAAGGGFAAFNAGLTLDRVQLIGNSSKAGSGSYSGSVAGGGAWLAATRAGIPVASLTNVTAADNLASPGTGSNPGGGGGGIQINDLQANLTHITLARNQLASPLVSGQALLLTRGQGPIPTNVTFNYGIVADHTCCEPKAYAVFVTPNATLTFNRGLFAHNTSDTNTGGTINGLSTMSHPSSAGFFSAGSPNYNYHLRLDSAAKDQATGSATTHDIDVQARPYDKGADLGADEYWPFPLAVFPGNSSLQLDWTQGASLLAGGVSRYEIRVTCPTGAHRPNEGACDQPFSVGAVTNFRLTGLTNSKQYTLLINAKDAAGNLIATSTSATGTPTDKFIALPLIAK